MSKYIIGIDGGGTKTRGVLFDLSGNEILAVEYGYANFIVNEDVSKVNIELAIDKLVVEVSDDSELLHIQLGVAGASKLEANSEYVDYLAKKYNTSVDLVTDAEIALYSIKKDRDMNVIMVLGGTGSVVMINDETGSSIIGGFGHLLGDEGSSYHLAITALRNVISEFEDGKDISKISKAILKEIDAVTHYEIKDFVYNKSKSRIANLSLFISSYALEGNQDAINLFVEEGKHLARQTYSAFKKLNNDSKVIIGIKGGFLRNAPYVKETLLKELKKFKMNYEISQDLVEPVVGAYYLGLKNILMR